MKPLNPKKIPKQALRKQPDKDHWSVADSFDSPAAAAAFARAFVHRNYTIGMHTHDFYEINIVLKGEGTHHFLDANFAIEKSDVFVIPPGTEHAYVSNSGLDVFHLLVHPFFLDRYQSRLSESRGFITLFSIEPFFRKNSGLRHCLHISDADFAKVQHTVDLLIEESEKECAERPLSVESLSLYLINLICSLQSRMIKEKGEVSDSPGLANYQSLQNVMSYIEKKSSSRITLDELARKACMQKNYFCRFFRNATGMTPMEYFNSRKIIEAKKLLRNGRSSISEIGEKLSFFDTAHFSRTFMKFTGVSPRGYRTQL